MLYNMRLEMPNLPRQSSDNEITDCFIVNNSTITSTRSLLILNCRVVFNDSFFRQIENFIVYEISISRSKIEIISHGCLDILNGPMHISDVHFNHLYENAIIMPPNSHLTLHNVVIDRCDEPCFNISSSKVSFNNVTINNEKVENVSALAFLQNIRLKYYQESKTETSRDFALIDMVSKYHALVNIKIAI